MDDVLEQLARELSEAISRVLASDSRIDAVVEKGRELGYQMHFSLEAVIGFAPRITAICKYDPSLTADRPWEMNGDDKRFLKSLRIADEQTAQEGKQ